MSEQKSFNSLDQLPADVKVLPTLAQQLWMAAYNSAESLGKEAQPASDEAWGKVKSGWELGDDGFWHRKTNKLLGDILKMKTILNRTSDKGYFKTWIPFATVKSGGLKVITKEVTTEDGKEPVKRKFLQGVASNTAIDKENERVSPKFIKKMQKAAVGLNVFLEHDHTLDKTLGIISEAGGDDENFWAETMLEPEEDNENVKNVLRKSANGIRLGYSIGGKATEITKGVDETTGKEYVGLEDGELYEVSVTPMPAGQDTWVTPIAKSMREFLKEYEEKEVQRNKEDVSDTFVSNNKQKTFENIMKLFTVENLDQKELSKALEEMVQAEGVKDQMFDLWWAFRDAVHMVTFDDNLTPEQKKSKIVAFSNEFATKIESLSSTLAGLIEVIDETVS